MSEQTKENIEYTYPKSEFNFRVRQFARGAKRAVAGLWLDKKGKSSDIKTGSAFMVMMMTPFVALSVPGVDNIGVAASTYVLPFLYVMLGVDEYKTLKNWRTAPKLKRAHGN